MPRRLRPCGWTRRRPGNERVDASAAAVGGQGSGTLRLGQKVAVTGGRSGGNPAAIRERERAVGEEREGERKWIDAVCDRAVDFQCACERQSERRNN
jgi:hypothetical protein